MKRVSKFYGKLAFDAEAQRWRISDLEPHVALRLKQMFPRVPAAQSGTFSLVANPDVAADLDWFTTRYPLLISEADRRALANQSAIYFDTQAEAERILLPDRSPQRRRGLKKGQRLRKYQKTFLDYLEITRSLLLIDDIGLGKTYEGLAVGLLPDALPMVIVVQPHLQHQWMEKAAEFINLRTHAIKTTRPYDLPEADIYIFKYTQLAGWVDVLATGYFKAIVYDEVQELRRGTESSKGTAANSLQDAFTYRVGMTATLVYNYGIEAWNIVELLRRGLLGSRYEFLREWCSSNESKGVVENPAALGAYLREQHMLLRRTRGDVGQEAKQGAPHFEWLDPDEKSVQETALLAEQLAITALTGQFSIAGQAAREFDMRLREITGIAKARAVAAYVRMFVETGTPVVVWGWHREVWRILQRELADLKPLMYTGSESPSQKERNKKAFIAGESDILFMSLRSGAGADGIQHRCSTGIFAELDWSPQIHTQCGGRLDRDGQEDSVFLFYCLTEFGSDPTIIDMQGVKDSQDRGIIDPGMEKEIYQADPERIRRLAQDYLKLRGKPVPERSERLDSVSGDSEQAELALI